MVAFKNKFLIFLIFTFFIFLGNKDLQKKVTIFFHLHCLGEKTCYGEDVKVNSKIIKVKENDNLLSFNGSSRATAYQDLNKIIETENGYLVSWLDNYKDKFRLKLRYFTKENISKFEYDLGEVVDNHGGGSIAISDGNTIHVAYYPHGDDHVLYRQGTIVNEDFINWEKPIAVGDHLTYPKIFFYNEKIFITARRTKHSVGKDQRPQMVIYEKKINKKFSKGRILLKSRLDGYANFHFFININKNKNHLYLTLKRHEGSNKNFTGLNQSIEIFKFRNNLSIESMFLDIDSGKVKPLFNFKGGLEKKNSLEIGPGIIFDNKLFISFVVESFNSSELFLVKIENNKVDLRNISFILDKLDEGYSFTKPIGGMAIDKENNSFLAASIVNLKSNRPSRYLYTWGDNSSSVFIQIFNPLDFSQKCEILISNPTNHAPEWLPHIKTVHGKTILLYTSGSSGRSNFDNVKTKVFIRNLSEYQKKICVK